MAEQEGRRAGDAGGPAKAAGERRRYNRRRPDSDSTPPPYYEIFDRIASALEGIESIETEELLLRLTSPLRPGLLQQAGDDQFSYLVMPIRLNGAVVDERTLRAIAAFILLYVGFWAAGASVIAIDSAISDVPLSALDTMSRTAASIAAATTTMISATNRRGRNAMTPAISSLTALGPKTPKAKFRTISNNAK